MEQLEKQFKVQVEAIGLDRQLLNNAFKRIQDILDGKSGNQSENIDSIRFAILELKSLSYKTIDLIETLSKLEMKI